MAKYFIYYSLSGNGDYLASLLDKKGYTPIKVETVKPIGKPNFFRIIKYGGQAMMGKCTPIKDIELEIKDNDEVIVGSPIWNDRLSTPINSLLKKFNFDKDSTMFILYPAGESTKKSFVQLKKLGFSHEPIVISYPLKKTEQTKKILAELK